MKGERLVPAGQAVTITGSLPHGHVAAAAAMDWLEHRQDAIEAELARRHLGPEPNPARMALSGAAVPLTLK